MEVVILIVILAAVAAFVLAPLRRNPGEGEERLEDTSLAELEARKEAKYREIKDTELDHAQGKLAAAEYEAQNAELRAEAIEILKAIDHHKRQAASKNP